MSYWLGIPLLLVTVLTEVSVLPLFIEGTQPNLTLVLLVAWLMTRGSREAFLLIPIGGLLLGLVDGAPLGTGLLALAPVAILHEIRGTQLTEGGFVMTVAFTIVMTAVYHAVYLGVFALQGAGANPLDAFSHTLLPVCLVNLLFLLPVYFVLHLSSQNLRRAAYA